ncbi:MAG: pantetheine-phosphate adenylyltransferase [Ornithinimicrobium sp.]
MTSRAVCPGSFDPVTHGHLDIIERAAALFDEVIVAVLHNPSKHGYFSVGERIDLLEQALAPSRQARQITVASFADRLVVDVCQQVGAQAIVKGLRGPSDYSYETPMARMNAHMSGVETVFLAADPQLEHVSSSLIREISQHGADVRGLVPEPVREALLGKIGTAAPLE